MDDGSGAKRGMVIAALDIEGDADGLASAGGTSAAIFAASARPASAAELDAWPMTCLHALTCSRAGMSSSANNDAQKASASTSAASSVCAIRARATTRRLWQPRRTRRRWELSSQAPPARPEHAIALQIGSQTPKRRFKFDPGVQPDSDLTFGGR